MYIHSVPLVALKHIVHIQKTVLYTSVYVFYKVTQRRPMIIQVHVRLNSFKISRHIYQNIRSTKNILSNHITVCLGRKYLFCRKVKAILSFNNVHVVPVESFQLSSNNLNTEASKCFLLSDPSLLSFY